MFDLKDEVAELVDYRNFYAVDAKQKRIRNRLLVPQFYERYAHNGRFIFADSGPFSKVLQKQHGIDTIVQAKDGRIVTFDEKIVQWPKDKGKKYEAFALETQSNTVEGSEADGWMVYGMADWMLYCFEMQNCDLECYQVEFQSLKEWFWPKVDTFPKFRMKDTKNHTAGRVVSIEAVKTAVKTRFFVCQTPVSIAKRRRKEGVHQMDLILDSGIV